MFMEQYATWNKLPISMSTVECTQLLVCTHIKDLFLVRTRQGLTLDSHSTLLPKAPSLSWTKREFFGSQGPLLTALIRKLIYNEMGCVVIVVDTQLSLKSHTPMGCAPLCTPKNPQVWQLVLRWLLAAQASASLHTHTYILLCKAKGRLPTKENKGSLVSIEIKDA